MTAPAPVVHVVDDDESLRTALSRLLRAAGYEVRAYESAGNFLIAWPGHAVGCLVLDLRMPGPSGLDLQEALAKFSDAPPIIFLTGYGDIPTTVHAIQSGAVDFLTKPVKREKLLAAVEKALAWDAERRAAHEQRRALRMRYETLTPRERQVLEHVVAGQLNKQIAADLGTAERTVKAHRARVMDKMAVGSVADLVRAASALQVGASGG